MGDVGMMVELVFRNKKFQVKSNIAVRDALKRIGIEPESVLVIVNDKLSTDDVILKEGDAVKLIAVVSGGAGGMQNGECRMHREEFRSPFCIRH